MAVEEWFLQEEGCLQFNGRPTSISYSPTSHCFIATLEDGSIEVLDVSSGRTLKRTFLEGGISSDFGSLRCRFCPGVEKLFVTDRRTVGLRKDLNGVLLLDSILQAPVAEDCDAPITLELTLADVKQLQTGIETCLTTAVPPVLDVMETLKEQIKDELNKYQNLSATNTTESSSVGSLNEDSDKTAKWVTCKLRLPAGALLCAFDGMVTSLHKNNRTSAALPIASAMLARVMALTGTSVLEKKGQPVYKQLMFVEAARRQTFSTWPHTDYKWAYPEAMAQAGFYHQPACTGDDRAMCFTCSVCLVCWEPTDEPWSEHERHSAECPFVRGDRTENVPMSVSLATTPAKHHGNSKTSKITSISSSSCPCLMATSSNNGHIVVWDLSDQLKVYSQFMVDSQFSSEGKEQKVSEDPPAVQEAWTESSMIHKEKNILVDKALKRDTEGDDATLIDQGGLEISTKKAKGENKEKPEDLTDSLDKETTILPTEDEGTIIEDLTDLVQQRKENIKDNGMQIEELGEEESDVAKLLHSVEAEDYSEGIVEEPKDDEKVNSEDPESINEIPSKLHGMHVTASAIVCPSDQDHQHLKKLYTPEHKPVLIAGISPCLNFRSDTQTEVSTDSTPYLMLYDASAEKVPPTTSIKDKDIQFKPGLAKVPGSQQMGSQEDLYSVLSSDDDLEHEFVSMAPSNTFQSLVMKKCAAAISGRSEQHIDEVLNMKHRNVIQKIKLPNDALEMHSSISQIIPCLDGKHMLVVVHLKEFKSASEISSKGEVNMYFDHDASPTSCPICLEEKLTENISLYLQNRESEGCLLLLYRLLLNDKVPTLSEPLQWKKLASRNSLFNVIGLPVDSSENLDLSKELSGRNLADDSEITSSIQDDSECNGRFAGVTQDGSVTVIDACSLDTVAKYCLGKDQQLDNAFNDIVYCPGIDCLCCSTFQGYLYFLSLVHNTESIDSSAAGDSLLSGTDSLLESISLSEDQTIQNLLKLLKKTEFENLVPRFTAIVPPAWSEMQQEQQQRQHPQHLHQQSLGDATLHTRTWKLQPEAKNNSSGEQIFELLLSKQCHVGHIDIKFSLNSSSDNSAMKVYLLKPWSLKSWQQENTSSSTKKKVPILSAAKENGHVLCGPVEIEKGPHMRIALTCPDLVKTRHRILLLVFESSQPQVHLEELSVTVRRFKYSPKPSLFMQYSVMLEEPAFHQRLLDIICSPGQGKVKYEKARKLALDLLCWIAGVCVHTPIRRNSLIHQVQRRLNDIIPVCFLQSGRTIAHQCSILLLLCARQSTWDGKYGFNKTQEPIRSPLSQDLPQRQSNLIDRKVEYSRLEKPFRTSVLQGIIEVLPNTINALSAGGLHYLFSILVGYAALEDVKKTTDVCQELLTEVSTKMDSLMLHLHSTIQARYGLYGLPFEPVLFDLTIPPIAEACVPWTIPPVPSSSHDVNYSQQSYWPSAPKQPTTSTAIIKPTTGISKTASGLQDLESKTDHTYSNSSSLVAHQGLLEVEPLHFNCTSSSDGARVERSESTPVVPVPGLSTTSSTNGQSFPSMLPSVSVSAEPDVEFLKQHCQQLAKLHLHKQELEKHKQELEELAMWSIFPKIIPNPAMAESSDPSGNHYFHFPPEGNYYYPQHSSGGSVNLSLQKKMTNKKITAKKCSQMTPVYCQQSQLPLPQSLIIERLHSGARHHVVLDFGTIMEITDIIIPSCSDLSSLSIDAWLEGEEKDAQRIAIVSDIGSCGCVIKDLHPPPVCQFVKLTVVGRPRSNAKVKMKIGEFYGRPHTPTAIEALDDTYEHRLRVLENMYEEVHCHYSLACSKLEVLVENSEDKTKIQSIYDKCIDLQLQLNFVHQSIKRVQTQQVQSYGSHTEAGYDQLRVLCTCLSETLVALAAVGPSERGFLAKASIPTDLQIKTSSLPRDLCEVLFKNLVIHGNPVLRVRVAALLLHTSCTKPWWGSFLADVLKQFFSSSQQTVFPQERVFVVLSVLAQQSPDVMPVMKSLIRLLDDVLSGEGKLGQIDAQCIDMSLVGWIVLLLAHILNTCGVGRIQTSLDLIGSGSSSGASSSSAKPSTPSTSDKWDFIVPSPATQTSQQSTSSLAHRQNRHKLRRQISIHEKQLQELQKQQKKIMEGQGGESSEVQHIQQAYAKSKFTSQALKHIKDLVKLRHQEAEASSSKGKAASSSSSSTGKAKVSVKVQTQPTVHLFLSQISTIPVMKKMIQLVLNMESCCPADLVLLICKVVALLSSISQPTVYLTDVLSASQVESILGLCSSNRAVSWTRHALITLLQDLIRGFKSDVQVIFDEETKRDTELCINANRSETKQQTSSLSMPSMENMQSPLDYPMDWTNVPPIFPGYDVPPHTTHLPTAVTSSLYVQPKPQVSTQTTPSTTSPVTKMSTALDARLELGVTMEAEWDLKSLQVIQGDAVLKGMKNGRGPKYLSTKVVTVQTISSSVAMVKMFFNCFDKLFSECKDPRLDLSSHLELWLRLNAFLPPGPNKTQLFIPLGKTSLANMLSFLASRPSISLQTFYLAFEAMRIVLEKSTKDTSLYLLEGVQMYTLAEVFVSNPNLLRVLQRTLIEGSPKDYGTETGVGTSGTGIKQVEAFLSSLATTLEKQEDGALFAKFHNMLLELLCSLASGNVNYSGRPVQMKPILRVLLKHSPLSTKGLDVSLVIKLLNLTTQLSLQNLQRKDEISLQASSHFHETPRLTTSSNLMEVKPTDGPWIVHSTWLTKLLGVIIMLVQLPAEKSIPIADTVTENVPDTEQQDDGGSKKEEDTTNEEFPCGSSKESKEKGKEDLTSIGDIIDDDASDSMVKTLQAMAKAVEKNASQSSEEAQPIINVIEEESSTSSSSGTDTSGGEEDNVPSAGDGPLTGIKEEVEDEEPAHDVLEVKKEVKEEIKDGNSPKPAHEKDIPLTPKVAQSVLPDCIIADNDICLNLLQCLNLCSSNNIGVLLTGANILNSNQNVSVSGDPVSVEDGILQVMSVIYSQLTHQDLLVAMVIKYLSGCQVTSVPVTSLSEPFLWFLLRMLDSNKQVEIFNKQGGYELLLKNLVSSYSFQLNENNHDLIPVMRQLTKLAHKSNNGTTKLLLNAVWEAEKDRGLVNYAPFGTISCSRASSHPADTLLKTSMPHRRTRSAAWSYHFYPGELWCDLTIYLPTPILLHAVHIHPHTAGLTSCPSYIALDYSVDGTVMTPASKPVMTSGLSVIRLHFDQPQIAQRICVRCRRPRDSESLGLSQIKVWGTSLYGPPAEQPTSNSQGTYSDCLNWVCLLHHCLHRTPSPEISSLSSSSYLGDVFGICISLLGAPQSDLFSGCQEAVLQRLALEFSELGQVLLKKLLVSPGRAQVSQSTLVPPSAVQLVFKLGKTGGDAAKQRLRIMADWLESLSSYSHVSVAAENVLTGLVQAIAAVLWSAADSDLASIVQEECREQLFRSLYDWSQLIARQEPLKQAIDYIICSLCHVCPTYFQLLLHLTDAQELVDQARTHDGIVPSYLVFVTNRSSMETLARACQSPITSHLLLASGLLNVLHVGITRLCNNLLASHGNTERSDADSGIVLSLDYLSDVLSFMAVCAEEPVIKTWCGTTGKGFWKPLMLVLGSGILFSPISRNRKEIPPLATRHRIALESSAIKYFSQCIKFYPDNQEMFARLLCEVMEMPLEFVSVTGECVVGNTRGVGLDGFLRRLVLETLLQDEGVKVCIHYGSLFKPFVASQEKNFSHGSEWHPRFGAGYNILLLKVNLSSTIEDLDEMILPHSSTKRDIEGSTTEEDKTGTYGDFDDLATLGDTEFLEGLSIAAGFNVKSKRAKSTAVLRKISSYKPDARLLRSGPATAVCRHHALLGNMLIQSKTSLSSLLSYLMSRDLPAGTNCIELSVKTCGNPSSHVTDDTLLTTPPMPTALHKFATFNGLAILSSRLSCSLVMNQTLHEAAATDSDQLAFPLAFPLPLFSLSPSVLSSIPGHSLAAFGLFISLPGYANVLLRNRPKAQCLLRLLLGAEDDGNGGHVLSSQISGSLPTLPFQILRLLFHSTLLSSDDGVLLRQVSLEQGAIQLVLMCLGVLSHHEPRMVSPTDRLALQTVAALTGNLLRGSDQGSNSEKQYWAKGTGFGTGSTASDWDIENAMKKQRAEEAHTTCMLQVLGAYIHPSGVQSLADLSKPENTPDYKTRCDKIPPAMTELLSQSCLVPTLSSYLRNDSVLDMARHVPLYQAVLEVMRALATCPSLVHLLAPSDGNGSGDGTSLAALIGKMKRCVDTYSKTLRTTSQAIRRTKRDNKAKATSTSSQEDHQESEQDNKEADAEGLALLIPDIQETAVLVQDSLSHLHDATSDNKQEGDQPAGSVAAQLLSNEEKYLAVIKPLQFDMYEIVSEEDTDRLEFTLSYHFASTLRSATTNGETGSPARARRLAQEITSLSTSLPLSSSSSVFVRCDETRLDIMKVLITGPAETPYANGCFEFDVYFPQNYPNAPMQINFETTGHHTIRFNPNLYNDGKVCLSILNTWHGRPEEKWNPQTSSFLQVLVSTQSLILVAEPYFNEPGYERSRGTPAGKQNSQEYNANIRQATVKWAMLEPLRKPTKCFKEVIESHFYLKKDEILQQCETWIREIEALTQRNSGGRAVVHHLHSLRQHTAQLRLELKKLSPPKELQ